MQQINLYQDRFRKVVPPLGAVRMAQAVLAVVGVLVALTLVLSWQDGQRAAAVQAAQQDLTARQQELARLQASLPPPQEDPLLQQSLRRLERELAAKQGFLEHFDGSSLGDTRGFSAYMRGLARRPLADLWLSRIELAGDGALAFSGSALKPGAVPAFVRTLNEEAIFQGREFRTLQMAEQDGRIDFDLRSRELEQ